MLIIYRLHQADKIVELVKGDDIKHWYLDSNNYGHGQLSNSV